MRFTYSPEKLKKRGWPYNQPVFAEYERRARECLLWRMAPEYYDSMTEIEYLAWIEAWNKIQKEQEGQ